MASDGKSHGDLEDEEDLEALRWAALQTLKQTFAAPGHYIPQDTSGQSSFLSKKETSIGVARVRLNRNDPYNRHRINSNLITIVPTVQEDSFSRVSVPANGNESFRRVFPEKRFDMTTKDEEKQVSTKFTRFHDSSGESSSEESEVESSSSDNTNIREDTEPEDILPVKDEDENSLDRLMDQLEQEINDDIVTRPSEAPVSGNRSVTSNMGFQEAKKSVNTSKDNQNSTKTGNSKLVSNNCLKRKTKRTTTTHKEELKYHAIENHTNDSSLCNSTVSQPMSVAGITSPKSRALCSPVAESPMSPKRSPSHSGSESQSRSLSKSPIQDSDLLATKTRKSRSRSPLPKFYYSSPRSFRSKSPLHLRSPRRSRSPYHSRSPRRSRSPRVTSPHRSRSPYLSRSSHRSRSPHRSMSHHRSRSPISRTLRRSRSLHRSRSPCHSRSPRRLSSRSPVRLRSPRSLRSSRSPRRWYPSPNRYGSNNNSYGRSQGIFSPRRQSRSPPRRQSLSPPIRRPKSPRRSLSPKRSMSPRRTPRSSISPHSRRLSPRRPLSPRRSPLTVRRQFSPRRKSLSPRYRQNSKSPVRRRPLSPQSRRSTSPRRLSPVASRKQFSPSLRRHLSPGRRSPHRSSSQSRRRSSRSTSRSPRRRSPIRNRSPVYHRTHVRSPPSPRRKASKSPVGRSLTQHSPLVNRKLSQWPSPGPHDISMRLSPSKHRLTTSLESKRKSLSPYKQQISGSTSPALRSREKIIPRNRAFMRIEDRSPQSPRRGDSQKFVRDARNVSNLRSHSTHSSPVCEKRSIPNSSSTQHKRYSRSPSLSLSPSPERRSINELQTKKSIGGVESFVTDGGKEKTATSNVLDSTETVSRKHSRSSIIRKDSREKFKKRILNRGKNVVIQVAVPVDRSDQRSRIVSSEDSSALIDNDIELTDHNILSMSVMEARRRKFQSCEPVELSNKRIRLKPMVGETNDTLKSENDEPDFMLDLELDKNVVFWSGEESPSDKEGRFKLSEKSKTIFGELNKTSSGIKDVKLPSRSMLIKASEDQSQRPSKGQKLRVKRDDSIASITEFKEPRPKVVKRRVIATRSAVVPGSIEVQNSLESRADDDKSIAELVSSEDEKINSGKTSELTRSKEGDLRTELSRRRAERLTKVGSIHEIHPSRLVRSAFKDAVGMKNLKKMDKTEKLDTIKKMEANKGPEKSDGRRVLLLKSAVVEHRVPSFSVTIPKDTKLTDNSPCLSKLPIRLRLGLPTIPGGEGETSASIRRGVRKVKLKRSVTVTSGSSSGDQV